VSGSKAEYMPLFCPAPMKSRRPSWCPRASGTRTENSFGAEPKSKSAPAGNGQFFPTGVVWPWPPQATFQSSPSVSRCDHLTFPMFISSATTESTWSSGERQAFCVPPAKMQLA
jgi:hypothetical protein